MTAHSPIELENELQRFVGRVIDDIIGTVGLAVIEYTTSRTSQQMLRFFEEMRQPYNAAEAEAAHRRIATAMQRATKNSWQQRQRQLRPAIYDPPSSSRMPKNGLTDAIENADFVQVSARGIAFGDISILDKTAKQWYRMNYGAAPSGQGSQDTFSGRFSNITVNFVFNNPPDAGYGLPRGGFKGPDGKWQSKAPGVRDGAFYPLTGSKQEFPTKGNVGYYFLDTGIAKFFELVGLEYGTLFRKITPDRRGRPPIIAEFHRTTTRTGVR